MTTSAMVGDHGQEGNRRKEIRCEADRRRAPAARRTDPQGQTLGAADHEGEDPAESRYLRGGRGVERGQIVRALETSLSPVYRARQQLVEGKRPVCDVRAVGVGAWHASGGPSWSM